MFAGLSRKNKYFTPDVTDELNAALKEIDEKIESHTATPLEPLLKVYSVKVTSSYEMVNNSFKAGNLLELSLQISIDEDLDISTKTEIAKCGEIDYNVISQACLSSGLPIKLIIENGTLYVIGSQISADDIINISEELIII